MQAVETFQYRLFFMNEITDADYETEESGSFARTFLLHTVLQAVDDALSGDVVAMLWVLSTGNEVLSDMGWGAINLTHPEMIDLELLDRTLGNEPVRRCQDCAHCFRDGEHATCLMGVWQKLGLQPEYGVQTVEKGARGKIHACGYWTAKPEAEKVEA